MEIYKQLIEYGLTENETKVYLFLAEKTEATAYNIAKETKIPRATAYLILDSLKEKGLVSTGKKNNVTYYTNESPNRLKKIVEEKISLTDLIIPQLRNLSANKGLTPTAKLYVGKDGMKTVFEDMLEYMREKKITRLYSITNSSIVTILPKYFPEWVRRREKLGVFTQMIGEHEGGTFPFETNAQREVRFLPANIQFDCSINIFGDRMAFYSIRGSEIYSITVESPTITTTIRQLFLLLFEFLGKK